MHDEADPIAEGFRQPPDEVTHGGLIYIARINDMRSFLSVFFSTVKSLQALAELAPLIVKEAVTASNARGDGFALADYKFSEQRQLLNEITLSRAVEGFDLYLQDTLSDIFVARPDMLRSEAPVDAATVIDLRTFDEIVFHIAERKLHELSFKPLSDLRKYVQTRTGIDLFSCEKAYNEVLVASEVRNLIAHNDCCVNEIFLRKVGKAAEPGMVRNTQFLISDEWVRQKCYALDAVVFEFDEIAAKKFGLPTEDWKKKSKRR